jgi:hypothetical protein
LVYKIYLPIVSPSFWTATIVLEPKADAVLPVGTPRTFTATLLDSAKMPWVGRRLSFSTDLGAFQGGGQYAELFTDSLGQATVTVVSAVPGTAHVRVWVDDNDNDILDEGEATDVPSTVTWIE